MVDEFIAKWENCPGSERVNYAVFLTELTQVLGLPTPTPQQDYQIDAPVVGGSEAGGTGFIDLYRRGRFILEAKQSKVCEVPQLPGLAAPNEPAQPSRYDELMRRWSRSEATMHSISAFCPPAYTSAGHCALAVGSAWAMTLAIQSPRSSTLFLSPKCLLVDKRGSPKSPRNSTSPAGKHLPKCPA